MTLGCYEARSLRGRCHGRPARGESVRSRHMTSRELQVGLPLVPPPGVIIASDVVPVTTTLPSARSLRSWLAAVLPPVVVAAGVVMSALEPEYVARSVSEVP